MDRRLRDPRVLRPPQINSVSPSGIRRGHSAELTISGANLAGNPRIIAPFGFKLETPAAKGDAANWKVHLTVAPDVGRRGLSDPGTDRRRDIKPVPAGGRPVAAGRSRRKTTARSRPPRRFRIRRSSSRGRLRATTSISSASTARRAKRSWSTPSVRGSARASTRASG